MEGLEKSGKHEGGGCAWYALYTRHQHEKTVARMLAGKGFEVFLPLYTAAHRWQDRMRRLSLPLFPGYVFLRLEVARRSQVVTTPGVHHFVPSAGPPEAISPPEIEAVRRLIEEAASFGPHPFLKRGDWVRIKSGPLEGLEGFLTRRKGRFKLVLSVELLQQSVGVEVEAADVVAASRPSPAPLARRWC